MADLSSGESFVDGQTVTAARLNNMINGGTVLQGFISAKSDVAPTTDDFFVYYDTASATLKKTTIAELFTVAGQVSSISLTMPTGFGVTGSPGSGVVNLVVSLNVQSGNSILASPADGSVGIPTFRPLTVRDVSPPSVNIASNVVDWSAGKVFWKILTQNANLTFVNTVAGESIDVFLSNDITGHAFTVTWPVVLWPGGTPPVQTSGAVVDWYRFVVISTGAGGSAIAGIRVGANMHG